MDWNVDQAEIMKVMRSLTVRDQADKLARYRVLNQDVRKGEILFVGSSLMEQFPINELLMTAGISKVIYNRGIGGFTTTDMLEHMEEMVFALEPAKIFINIGTNDIAAQNYRLEKLIENYEKIILLIQKRLPRAEIYMMAYYPVNENGKVSNAEIRDFMFKTRTNQNICLANAAVESLAKRLGCHFIDVSEGLRDASGRLKEEYTIEGVHMYANGYRIVLENLREYL